MGKIGAGLVRGFLTRDRACLGGFDWRKLMGQGHIGIGSLVGKEDAMGGRF